MTSALLAFLIALTALTSHGTPQEQRAAVTRGEPVTADGFIGVEWICDGNPGAAEGLTPTQWLDATEDDKQSTTDTEFCYAGLVYQGQDGFGPPRLEVGP